MSQMEKVFYTSGTTVRIMDVDNSAHTKTLPPKLYTAQFHPQMGYYLSITENKMQLPSKVYGDTNDIAKRIINTYNERNVSTGVLLTGEKGSGKTMLSSLVSNQLLDKGIPAVIISDAFRGTQFIDFINSLGDCVLIFDEYAKVYGSSRDDDGSDTEATLLTLLDGANKQKRLCFLIENSVWRISNYLLNRPGRIFYHFEYDRLSKEVLEDYCETMKVPNKIIKDLMLIRNNMRTFNFDMMKALIEEWKRYKGSVIEHARVLNIAFDEELTTYKVIKLIDNKSKKEVTPSEKTVETNADSLSVDLYYRKANEKNNGDFDHYAGFRDRNLKSQEGDKLILDNGVATIVLEKRAPIMKDYSRYYY